MEIRLIHIVLPVILSFLTATLGGISLGLLIPIAKGISANNYDFIQSMPVVSQAVGILHKLMSGFLSQHKAIFLSLAILVFVASALRLVLTYYNKVLTMYWIATFSKKVKLFVFKRFLSFGKLYFDRTSQGRINKTLDYSEKLLYALEQCYEALYSTFNIIVYFTLLFLISFKLTLFAVIVLPILHFSLGGIVKQLRVVTSKHTNTEMSLSRDLFNILSCMPLIKAYSKESQVQKIYVHKVELLRRLKFKFYKLYYLVNPVQEIIVLSALLSMAGFIAFIIARDQSANLAAFLVFFYTVKRILPELSIYNRLRAAISEFIPPIREISKIFDDKDKIFIEAGHKNFTGLEKNIKINHLNFSYDNQRAVLKNINLLIEKGKMTAIVGPTGSGKTTLVSLIMRLYDCPTGTIKIDGIDIKEFEVKSLMHQISVVMQDTFLLNDTIRNNVAFGLDSTPTDKEIFDALKKARLYDFIMSLPKKLDTVIGDRGIRLSGGEQQRTSIARALLRGGDILILDEATSSLDTKTEKLIHEAIEEATKNRTTIVIAHRLSTIRNADRIVVIENGELVEEGSLKELLDKKGKFYQYWQEQKFY